MVNAALSNGETTPGNLRDAFNQLEDEDLSRIAGWFQTTVAGHEIYEDANSLLVRKGMDEQLGSDFEVAAKAIHVEGMPKLVTFDEGECWRGSISMLGTGHAQCMARELLEALVQATDGWSPLARHENQDATESAFAFVLSAASFFDSVEAWQTCAAFHSVMSDVTEAFSEVGSITDVGAPVFSSLAHRLL